MRVLVGEFGIARWAPGREKWVIDCIEIFEKYNWDWCFHSYSGWNGWNPTFDANDSVSHKQDGNKNTETLKILKQYFNKNLTK